MTVDDLTISGTAMPTPAAADQHGHAGGHTPHDNDPGSEDESGITNLVLFIVGLVAVGVLASWWVVAAIAVLALMLFMHELGHYVTARLSGMEVTEFFLGFGPRVWSFHRGGTEYGIKAIWAGAYVRITGLTSIDEVEPERESRTYRAQSYAKRMWVITAGSFMHFVMAFVALLAMFTLVGSYGTSDPDPDDWEIGRVVPGTAAESIGLQSGDEVVSIGGAPIVSFDDLAQAIEPAAATDVEIVVERAGELVTLNGTVGVNSGDVVNDGFGLVLLSPVGSEPWQVGDVVDGSSAATFGFESGDLLEQAAGAEVIDRPALADALYRANGDEITISVFRRGESVELQGRVELASDEPIRGFLGIGPRLSEAEPVGLGEGLSSSASSFVDIAGESLSIFKPSTWTSLFSGDSAVPSGEASGSAAPAIESEPSGRPVSAIGAGRLWIDADNAEQRLFIFVLVNIAIGVINLAPLLPLDGGHAAIATYERLRELVTRRPHRIDAERLIPLTWAVILLLVIVGVWSVTLDIFAWPPV